MPIHSKTLRVPGLLICFLAYPPFFTQELIFRGTLSRVIGF